MENNVVWQPQIVEEMLQYYKEKIQAEGKHMIFRESHHEQCAQQINGKYQTNFTQRQVYHKVHKLKAQWKVILQAKNLSGANFDDVEKKILYDETEVVRMANAKDPRAKFINVPIRWYDEMEFIFQDKHATGEFTILQTPYDHPSTQDEDLIGDKKANNCDPSLQYDSDCLPDQGQEENGAGSSDTKRPTGNVDKGKRVKRDDGAIKEVTCVLRDMNDTMRFTHATHPNEALFKIIDSMEEYPIYVRLELQTFLADNEKTAGMLKGRPLEVIKQYVHGWVSRTYPCMM
ncbi:hypothetical protein QOZ80_7BG0603690 [Eleusine coracana subsp. coracana]|nr:hypothetical protein QOZ80_7BG0603690 [Eleusine coracana subsp. coracana]